jgi:radical SAM protein with 4Fe4S-binding SPASM domain
LDKQDTTSAAQLAPPQINMAAVIHAAHVMFAAGWTTKAYRLYVSAIRSGFAVDESSFQTIQAAAALDAAGQRELEEHDILVFRQQGVISTLHFTGDLTDYQKRIAFKSGIQLVELETSSQCNRRCHYCPNSKYDRRSSNNYMDDAVFDRVISDLVSINYSGALNFHGYNEPLMHLDNLTGRLKTARARLPYAKIGLFTNGDYLDAAALAALENCGVNALTLSVHMAPGKPWGESEVIDRVFRKAKELGLTVVLADFKLEESIHCQLIGSKIEIAMQEWNFDKIGSNRGQILPDVGQKTAGRTTPCANPLRYFIVSHKGDVVPCCDFVPDVPQHRDYVVGNVCEQSIFDIYGGEKWLKRRANVLSSVLKAAPCDTCAWEQVSFNPDEQQAIDRAAAAVNQRS